MPKTPAGTPARKPAKTPAKSAVEKPAMSSAKTPEKPPRKAARNMAHSQATDAAPKSQSGSATSAPARADEASRSQGALRSAVSRSEASPSSAPIELALQGGGSHGAFTWGVLDRLLEDESLDIAALSGTSAGALNAAVLATGWAEAAPGQERAGARAALTAFWRDVAGARGCFGEASAVGEPANWPGIEVFNLDRNPFYAWATHWMRLFSPYQLNPLGENALGVIARRHVRCELLREGPLDLFIIATAVRTGQPRVFDRRDLCMEAMLASACLPQLFRAVEIEGEPYWDGGYTGNPALWPLIYRTDVLDIVLVKINPLVRPKLPSTSLEISDRVNEITFNSALIGEMRAIDFVSRLVREGQLDASVYKNLRLHMVADDEALAPLQASSKLNTDWRFLQRLHALGRAAGERWLASHRADIGVRGTLNIRDSFLSSRRPEERA
jgi:NTE family protein